MKLRVQHGDGLREYEVEPENLSSFLDTLFPEAEAQGGEARIEISPDGSWTARAVYPNPQALADTLAAQRVKERTQRQAGGKARAAQRPDLAALVRQEALLAREARTRPYASARQVAGAIMDRVNELLEDRDALPVKLDTIRRKVPQQVGVVRVWEKP
ncbi:hypothetical protein [Paracoccus sp. KR1-242]|uniref:hypothetical protein n=1 Tax=Paracoccus sp. KR1-242 TaxID=3410028 RepID=UPI003C03B551